jgi:hypothetical protein
MTRTATLCSLAVDRWLANSPLFTVNENLPAMQSYRGIMLGVDNEDGPEASNTQFATALKCLGVPHQYAVYPGNHVGARFISHGLPFFERQLDSK